MQKKCLDEKPNDDAKDRLIAELRAENERLRELQGKALAGSLTDSKIEKLTRRGTHRDQENLYIQVPSEGSKYRSWVFRWNDCKTGKPRRIGLGSWPDRNIQSAREAAMFLRQALRDGNDPKVEWEKRRQGTIVASGRIKTFKQVAVEWWEVKIKPKDPKYARKIENQLNKWVYPIIGNMLITTIDQKTIIDDAEPSIPRIGLKRLYREMYPTGHDIQMYLERIFDYGIFRDYCAKNPAAWGTLKHVMPDRDDFYQRKPRDSLLIDEMYPFLQRLRAINDRSARKMGHPMIAMLLEALAHTGVRVGELRKAQQGEFNRTTMTWNVPWFHRKGGKYKRTKRPIRPIPITPPFLRVLDQAAAKRKWLGLTDRDDALVFPSDKPGHIGKMINGPSVSSFVRRNFPGLKLHPHGFRSTLEDWRREHTRFNKELYEIQVDHNLGDETEQAYGHNLLLEARRKMMLRYSKALSTPPAPARKVKAKAKAKTKTGKLIDLNNERQRRSA